MDSTSQPVQPAVDEPESAGEGEGAFASLQRLRPPRAQLGQALTSRFARFALVLVLAALFLLFTLLEPGLFATGGNVKAMLSSESVTLILALAVVIPLRAGDFDLSVASVMVFASALAPLLWSKVGLPFGLCIVLTLLFGVIVGFVNSFFIVLLDLNAFVVTLGSMTLLEGLTTWISSGNLVTQVPHALISFSRATVFGLPAAVFYGWGLVIVLWYVCELTPFGRQLLFVGGNREAARLAGIKIRRVRLLAFVASAVISTFAGLVLVGKLGVADPTLGPSYLLPPYAAAFLGIAAVQLGRFNIGGTLIAVYLLIVATTGLLLLGSAEWVTNAFNGAALMLAVTFASLAGGRRARAT
ncbi:MAG TPA: ABC transporter permease [Solirubrobacteraceae bacterium]|jgi:ribose transport system permease protein